VQLCQVDLGRVGPHRRKCLGKLGAKLGDLAAHHHRVEPVEYPAKRPLLIWKAALCKPFHELSQIRAQLDANLWTKVGFDV
jgi:hypothetical protein